jgi:hypothetical protein
MNFPGKSIFRICDILHLKDFINNLKQEFATKALEEFATKALVVCLTILNLT